MGCSTSQSKEIVQTVCKKKIGSNRDRQKTQRFILDSDDELETVVTRPSILENNDYKFENHSKTKKSRLLPKKRKICVDNNQLKECFNATSVPEVSLHGFISESDSSPDSDDDYVGSSDIPWHNHIGYYAPKGKEAFPKSSKFAISDRMLLEKRIKKICKRQNISFEKFKIFTQGQLKNPENQKIWRMIVKIFPDRTLKSVAKYCKEIYNPFKTFDDISPNEYTNFKSSVEKYGESPKLLEEKLQVSLGRVEFLLSHYRNDKKIIKSVSLKWSDDDIRALLQYTKQFTTLNGNIDFDYVSREFNNGRTARQCRNKYRRVEGLETEDNVSIRKVNKITHFEKVKYFEELLDQVIKNDFKEESQLNFKKDISGPLANVHGRELFMKTRLQIEGVEKMKVNDVLKKIIEIEKKFL